MSHAFAARGARQTAVLAAIIGLHFAVYLAVTGIRVFVEIVEPKPPPVIWVPKPPPPLPPVAPTKPGPIEGYLPKEYPRPDIEIPEFPEQQQRAEQSLEGTVGEGVGLRPDVVIEQPKLRTRQAKVDAAINACYPAAARRMNEEGTVVALVTIGAAGSAVNWNVAQSSGFARLDSAIACVLRKLEFVAGRRDGQAVSMEAQLPIVFQLD